VQLLLDTHAYLWWNSDDPAIGPVARGAIADPGNTVFVSAATALEIAVKRAIGKLEFERDIAESIVANAFTALPIEVEHAVASGELPLHHRDPFDRLLIAQARVDDLTLVTGDAQIGRYDVATLDALA
jgi:PIN domain nuclease of toxin-antitoxin system